jgi:hypothetical protein
MTDRRKGIPRLDLYLAATMRPSADLSQRLQQAEIGPTVLATVLAHAKQAGFGDPIRVTRASVEGFFGRAMSTRGATLVYELALWPEHRYTWQIEEWGGASHLGFELEERPALPIWLSREWHAASQVFQPWIHTAKDVSQVLGPPDRDLSWGAAWEWHYGTQSDDRDLVFEFDYGLLREIRSEESSG